MSTSPKLALTTSAASSTDIVLRLLVALAIAAIVVAYATAEQTFHYWDYVAYQDMTILKSIQVREAVQGGWNALWNELRSTYESSGKDYSDLHALPLVPLVLLFGDGRTIYIVALALIYLLPYTLLVIALARRLVPQAGQAIGWLAAGLTLATPAIWQPTLRGYPDTAAAALVGLAVLLFIDDMRLERLRHNVLIGIALAVAVLVRRHFLYEIITFFLCLVVFAPLAHGVFQARSLKTALDALLKAWLRVALVVAVTVGSLCLLGWPFVYRLLRVDFGQLYASYQNPAGATLSYYVSSYGLLFVAMAVLGLALGIRSGLISRQVAAFALLFLTVSLAQWCFLVGQFGIHYTLHFTLWIVLGLVALTWQCLVRLRSRVYAVALTLLGLCYGLNALIGLTPLGASVPSSIWWLFATSIPPEQRNDRAELEQIVTFLREHAEADEPIFVAASSGTLSSDLLWHVDRELHEEVLSYRAEEFWKTRGLTIYQWTPFVDSRDDLPLEKLLGAQFVVIATPFQHHLRAEEQDLVRMVLTAFEEQWPLAQDFEAFPESYKLHNGVEATIYRRIRPTDTETVIATHAAMVAFAGESPNYQDWISMDASEHYISPSPDGSTKATLHLPAGASTSLIQVAGTGGAIRGQLSAYGAACGTVSLRLSGLQADGARLEAVETQIVSDVSEQPASLQVAGPYTRIDVTVPAQGGAGTCWVVIDGLRTGPSA
jgi:hypothetical protein